MVTELPITSEHGTSRNFANCHKDRSLNNLRAVYQVCKKICTMIDYYEMKQMNEERLEN